MEHTKTPWYVTKDYYGGLRISTSPENATNIDGTNTVFENTGRGAGDIEEADVKLIVKACNKYDTLKQRNADLVTENKLLRFSINSHQRRLEQALEKAKEQ